MFGNNYIKIFVVSITFLHNNSVKIKYLLEPLISVQEYKGLFEFSYITTNDVMLTKLTIGKWQKVRVNHVGHIVHIFN